MIDKIRLENLIQSEIEKKHDLGCKSGGSGHLGYRYVTGLNIKSMKEISYEGKKAFEVEFAYKIYTETEFTIMESDDDDPDEVFHAEIYFGKYLVDEKYNIITIK